MRAVTMTNPGEIDLVALATLGVNVKEGENPIGHFGTGLKYTIAKLLSEGCKITIWRGEDMVLLGKESVIVRGKEFWVVTMDGQRLGFTLDLGKNWPFWTTFRELYCNCIDEQGEIYSGAPRGGDIAPGRTTIMVEGDSFHSIFLDRENFVLSSPPMKTLLSTNVHYGETRALFYRGVRVYELPKPTKFRYNLLSDITLTEDRTLRSLYEAQTHLVWSLGGCRDRDLIREILTLPETYFEHHLDFDCGSVHSEEFRSVVSEVYHSSSSHRLNPSMRKMFIKSLEKRRDKYAPVKPNEIEERQLHRAAQVVRALGMEPNEYEVILVDSLGSVGLGEYRDGKIYISRRAFSMGTKMVAGTLYEEILHARDGLLDESRSMQNHLIDELMTVVEKHVMREPI